MGKEANCPECSETIDTEDIEAGLVFSDETGVSSAFICPECKTILGIGASETKAD
ncbi:MAG: hypothetical protein ABEK59_04390 [Halobacteria archaeon]